MHENTALMGEYSYIYKYRKKQIGKLIMPNLENSPIIAVFTPNLSIQLG